MTGDSIPPTAFALPRIGNNQWGAGEATTSNDHYHYNDHYRYVEGQKRLFSFGAIADVQYADRVDGWNYAETHRRYYRGGLAQLRRAVDVWLRDETHRFALQLGDVIDGCNSPGHSESALKSVKGPLERLAESLPLGVLNSLGNHELYNFPKHRWAREVDCSSRAKAVALQPGTPSLAVVDEMTSPPPPNPCPDTAIKSMRLDASGHDRNGLNDHNGHNDRNGHNDHNGHNDYNDRNGHNGHNDHNGQNDHNDHNGHNDHHVHNGHNDHNDHNERDGTDDRGGRSNEEEEEEGKELFYYSFCPDPSYRVVALDTYDVNAIRGETEAGRGGGAGGEGAGVCRYAVDILSSRNPNEDKNDSGGMEGLTRRFVQFNGGIGRKQLMWLEKQLQDARIKEQRVLAFGHVPIHPGEVSSDCLLWNYKDVLKTMHKFECVAMYISGHRHRETYFRDEQGVHHISLAAALEAPPDQEAFASFDVYPDRLELRGHGVVESRTLTLTEREVSKR